MNYKQRKELLKKRLGEITSQEIEKHQVVLLGDCVFQYLDTSKFFEGLTVYNNGIGGDTTEQLQESLYKRAIKFKPSKLFLSIGTNDFGFDNMSVREIYNNTIDIIQEIKRRSKDTEIYIVSVLPVNPANKDYIDRFYVDSRDNTEITMLNYYLKNYARKNRLHFIDAKKELATSFDQLDLNYTFDGFHLNEQGYSVLSKIIKQYI